MRHHDELTLDRLTDSERQEIFHIFAPQENMQIFGRGIRRRLPPMMQGDIRRIQLTYSLMFSLPGAPLLRYGDEIGMGDDLSLQGRTSVRTPMQWSDEANGGFSSADPDKLTHPVISEGEYRYQHVNVAGEQRDPVSLLNWMERIVRIRKQCPEFGYGELSVIETDTPSVFAHCCEWNHKAVIAVHNLADQESIVRLKSDLYKHLFDLFGDRQYESPDDDFKTISLSAYGYRWFRINRTH